MHIHKKPLAWQLSFFQILGIVLAIVLSLGVSLYFAIAAQKSALDRSISNASAMLSRTAIVREMLTVADDADTAGGSDTDGTDIGQTLSHYAAEIDALTEGLNNIDVVAICNTDSIRVYHTNKEMIGQHFIGDDEGAILSGAAPYITDGHGTMGAQRRAFYPVTDADGEIVGFVIASVLTTSIVRMTRHLITVFLLLGIVLIGLGLLLARMINRRLQKILLGYRPEDFSKMYIERAEVLDSLDEGIFAINTGGDVILMNDSARAMLQLEKIPPAGTKLESIYPETQLPRILSSAQPEYNINTMIHGHDILSSRIPVIEDGKTIGAVSIFRDKTEVNRLAEELTGARYMVDTLRAFNHEFKNKLHVILGFLEMGQPQKAADLILTTSMVSTRAVSEVTQRVQIPGIAALLIGKIIRGSELGIQVMLKHDSACRENALFLPTDVYITLLGNLIENALDELNHPDIPIKEIEVGINMWEKGCIISVDDTGRGIPEALRDRIFDKGFSTKGDGRGTGLYLIKDIVDRYHGILEVESEKNTGTSFMITFQEMPV